jgi:hypothetical protein
MVERRGDWAGRVWRRVMPVGYLSSWMLSAVPKIRILADILVLMERNGWQTAHTSPMTTDFSSKNTVSAFARLQTGYLDASCEWAS